MRTDAETETRILDAADAVFRRSGTAGARMQEIADEAGVNKGSLHYYFRSKNRLAEAVFQRAGRRLLPPILDALESDLPLQEKVARVIHHELETLSSAPELPGYLLSEMHHHPERTEQLIESITGATASDIGHGILSTLNRQINEAVNRGELRPITPEQFVTNLIALCVFPFAARPLMTAVLGDRANPQHYPKEKAEALIEFFLNALRP